MNNNIGFLVLAAGHSRRFGACKLSHPFKGAASVLDAVLSQIAPLHAPICVVTSQDKPSIITSANKHKTQIALLESPSNGLGDSIAFGVSSTQSWHGWIICLADMPWIKTNTYREVLNYAQTAKQVAPLVEGIRGHPVYFNRSYRQPLLALESDMGAAKLLDPLVLCTFDAHDSGPVLDVDTPQDLARN